MPADADADSNAVTRPPIAVRALLIEPWYSGSHARFADALVSGVDATWTVLKLPGRHWKWRMRGSAAWFATQSALEDASSFDVALCTSYVPLAELRGLVPAMARVPTALYFHENQLAYPVRDEHTGARDTHFGFTQLVSALSADACVFNSAYNRDSFLQAGAELLSRLPDAVPPGWIERIASRASVIPVPMHLRDAAPPPGARDARGPLLVWNHRWEHDKDPEAFFAALATLQERGASFRVAVCGERYTRAPAVFDLAHTALGARVEHWGFAESRAEYEAILDRADVAVSTANHEFLGLSMIEACHHGARPLVPDRLAYPEVFPPEYRYATGGLTDALAVLIERYQRGETLRADRRELTARFAAPAVLPELDRMLRTLRATTT